MPEESKPPLAYQVGGQQVTRGQFRVLLLLIFIYLVMTAQSNYAPGVTAWLQAQWEQHKGKVAQEKRVRQAQAATASWLAFAAPESQVVWEEDAKRAAQLLSTSGYSPIVVSGEPAFLTPYLSNGAHARVPAALPAGVNAMLLASGQHALVFLHGRRIGTGPERMVAVLVGSHQQIAVTGAGSLYRQPTEAFEFSLYKSHTFTAQSFGVNAVGEADYDGIGPTELTIGDSPSGVEIAGKWTPSKSPSQPGTLAYKPAEQLRVFAGQADPQDASHFTIRYELDGIAGTIDGWLRADGSVALEPRAGKRINSIWFPMAK